MIKVLRKLLVVTSCALLAFGCAYCVLNRETAKAENTATVSIDYCNLAFENNVYILYAVNVSGSEEIPTLCIWEETANRTSENITATLTPYATEKIEQVDYYLFAYKNLAAKQMTDNVYAKASVTGAESKEIKYSILQYAENMKNSGNEKLDNLLTAMLEYGTMAQIFDGEGYKLDRLANAKYYSLTVENGTLFDGTSSGLFTATETVFVTAPEEMDEKVFNCWKDGDGNVVDVTNGIKLTANTTLTATYKSAFSEGLEYNLINDGAEYEVTGIGSCTDTELIIPDVYNGKPVTSIVDRAFSRCVVELKHITVSKSVKTIGSLAFSYCPSIESVVLYSTIEEIEYNAFAGSWGNWTRLDYNGTIDDWVQINGLGYVKKSGLYINGEIVTVANIQKATKIKESAFNGCSSLTSVIIGDSITDIGASAFKNCESLENVSFGKNVENIGNSAFYNCSKIDNIVMPNKVTVIQNYIFYGCSSLTDFTFNENISSIGNDAFSHCSSLINVEIPNSVIDIGDEAFDHCSSLAKVEIPNSVKDIGARAFYYCSSLKNVVIGSGVDSIGMAIFYNCKVLEGITFIDYSMWYMCTNMDYWQKKINGTLMDLSNSSTNVTYFTDTYDSALWYKLD